MSQTEKKGKAAALCPIVVFLVLYVGSGIYYQYVKGENQGFYIMSVVVAFTIALVVALLQNRKLSFQEKLKVMSQGVGDENIVAMVLIFLFAGVFSSMAQAAGGSESTAYLLLDILPANQLGNRFLPDFLYYIDGDGNFLRNDFSISSDCSCDGTGGRFESGRSSRSNYRRCNVW